ncbi:MAG: T9SS type A sorting domain-containing protein [Bacteroidales bacterium]|nr:T9SS type A sorting domain-containing protein [Bacteroidales bacterium]MCF8389344.1 T9SS type A sorting domain-containing protein [Bacteroidales bacterium]
MKRKLLIALVFILSLPDFVGAVSDTIPDLIISETRLRNGVESYAELCNTGTVDLDLGDFKLYSSSYPGYSGLSFKSGTILKAGETYVISDAWEFNDNQWPKLYEVADTLLYHLETPDTLAGDIYPLGPESEIFRRTNAKNGFEMYYFRSETDSISIDCVNFNLDANGVPNFNIFLPIAGVEMATANHTLVRKANVLEGNLRDWDKSRGTGPGDSEWILIPLTSNWKPSTPPDEMLVFTTVGHHGDAIIVASGKDAGITVDLGQHTITVPWGIIKGYHVINYIDLGPGMAWDYVESSVFEDSVHTIMQSGDKLVLWAVGNTLKTDSLTVQVSPPAVNMASVFPLKTLLLPDTILRPGIYVPTWGGSRYSVIEEDDVIDTIGNVPFATRIDTLYKYLEHAPNGTKKVIWVDGVERIDLKNGDILEITAEDGITKKQYYIDVQEINKNEDAFLSAITWPDITLDDMNFDLSWTSDTIPKFSRTTFNYIIPLKQGTQKVPALVAYHDNLPGFNLANCKVDYKPAISLKGGVEERTSVFTVTSESDSRVNTYRVQFEVAINEDDVQKFNGDPFFSEYQYKLRAVGTHFLEIANPGNEELDLSRYLIASGSGISAKDVIENPVSFLQRYTRYVPGYKFTDDTITYNSELGQVLQIDNTDPWIEANGGVFVIAGQDLVKYLGTDFIPEEWFDISFPMVDKGFLNKWGLDFDNSETLIPPGVDAVFFLFRIENDSILDGTKEIKDFNDFTLVDQLGYEDGTAMNLIADPEVAAIVSGGRDWSLSRRPEVYKGNPSYVLSAGTEGQVEWFGEKASTNAERDAMVESVGSHVLNPVTAFKSTVSSLVYLVDPGFEKTIGITGVSNAETVEQFYTNLIKASTGQVLVVKSHTSGLELALTDAVSAGDTLIVTSETGLSVTKYIIDLNPQDSNTKLITIGTSTLVIADGKVSGFDAGKTVRHIMSEVKAESEKSIVTVVNAKGELVPMKKKNVEGNYVDLVANSSISIVVTAVNGDHAAYQLKPNGSASDAYVISDVYPISQENLFIDLIPDGSRVTTFMNNLIVADGASVKILDRIGFVRTDGSMAYDDVLEVVSEDASKTVIYRLNFASEIVNQVPVVSIVLTGGTDVVRNVAFTAVAQVDDDGLPNGTLEYEWSVLIGDASKVTISANSAATTDFTISENGSYTLKAAVSDGELTGSKTVDVSVGNPIGIDEAKSGFRMYPNPTTNKLLNIELTQNNMEISIVDITGKLRYKAFNETDRHVVDLSNFSSGIYFVKIQSGTDITTQKLVVVK